MFPGDGRWPMPDDTRLADDLEHIVRHNLPWRDDTDALTECGRPAENFPTITRDELIARIRRLGRKRTAFTVCITCAERTQYAKPWDVAPEDVLSREIQRRQPDQLRRELAAITTLIANHPDEFQALLTGLAGIPSLAEHRRTRHVGGPRG